MRKLEPNIKRRPSWLKVSGFGSRKYLEVTQLLKEYNLHTVCQEANCPNRGECYTSGTATFLILGPNCTRNCSFCNVTHGKAKPVDEREPERVARTVDILNLKHAVITSVTRDDLPDGGARQFVEVIRAIRKLPEKIIIEVLTPDFQENMSALNKIFQEKPEIFNHNIETVSRLYPSVRPQADYQRSLRILKAASDYQSMAVKSGLMVGLSESMEELDGLFGDLASSGVDYLTIGQYLAPSQKHHPIVKYYHPDEFDKLARLAESAGIEHVFSAPLVRSSYRAFNLFHSQ
jgi:lipoic acid synthetase